MIALTAHAPLTTTWGDTRSTGIDEKMPAVDERDGARLVRILCRSQLIGRYADLLAWLKGEVQQFLPHQMLIASCGDFARWNVKSEVVSSLPGVRAGSIGGCAIDDVVRQAYAHWLRGGRQPLVLEVAAAPALLKPCTCVLHSAFRGMRSLFVHGVRDQRSGCDSLYIALDPGRFVEARDQRRFVALAHLLLCQIDIVWRRTAAFRLDDLPAAEAITVPGTLRLSSREHEILGRLSRGSTNRDIAEALEISCFTVKNHLKRIFRKIGVSNRTQAAARYNEAVAQSAKHAQPVDQPRMAELGSPVAAASGTG
jgi:transcriptional regulator EpsA